MRKIGLALLLTLVAMLGCGIIPMPLGIVLSSPANGGMVNPNAAVLTWVGAGTNTYEVQVASDSSFQKLVLDEANLTNLFYTVPSGKLHKDTNYFWRARAFRGSETSGWTAPWSFITTGGTPPTPGNTGTINIITTMDGEEWMGSVSYTVSGPKNVSGSSTPQDFNNMPTGYYTLNYSRGGPSDAVLESIKPSPSQTLTAGGTINFTLRFRGQATSGIQVYAMLDGSAWSGSVTYNISGPSSTLGYSVPYTFSSVSPGTYTLSYVSGGPYGASLTSISPSPVQTLSSGTTTIYTLIFSSGGGPGSAAIKATLNGAPWSGPVSYTITQYAISGPVEKNGYSVPKSFSGLSSGNIQLSYNSGGPSGATLSSISPSAQQTLSPGGTVSFTLNFTVQQAYGRILVNATLDGAPWQTVIGSGAISYSLQGPTSDSGSTIPKDFADMPTGAYVFTHNSGGPTGATLDNISPSSYQTLYPNSTITYTLNFRSQAKGTVTVNATMNGEPWSGEVNYALIGPYPTSGGFVPNSFSNAPAGTYSISYSSGGPPSCVFEGVYPSSQELSSGGHITFTLRFVFRGVNPLVQ